MKLPTAHIAICLFGLLMAVLTGCSGHGDSVSDDEELFNKNGTYFQLTLRCGAPLSRGPQGGEDGDGRLGALENENKTVNATIFLYQANDGINAPASTPISYAFYAPSIHKVSDTEYSTDVLHSFTPITPGLYHVLVVTNLGDLTQLAEKTLGEVRDYAITQPYAQTDPLDPSTANRFVMTNEADATVTITGEGGIDHVKQITLTVERLAARIDFSPGVKPGTTGGTYYGGEYKTNYTFEIEGTIYTKKGYLYKVIKDDKSETGDLFLLTEATPFNLWNSDTYLIKRVCDTKWQDYTHLSYLGLETKNELNEATNYVVGYKTFDKTSANFTDAALKPKLVNRNNESYDHWNVRELSTGSDYTNQIDPSDSNLKYYVLTYARENTIFTGSPKESYATGIRIDGYYGKKTGESTYSWTAKSYYHYIRHADPHDTNAEAVPMKYGIVRNNVYRVYVNSVTSLGLILIEVKDWISITLPEIQM